MSNSLRNITWLFLLLFAASMYAQSNFSTSLHATRNGKNFWYGADTSVTHAPAPGFETLTGVPISHPNVACEGCHAGDGLDANGDPYPASYQPGCVDCHATNSGWTVSENDCYDCHSRQKTEAVTLGYSDVHRSESMKCWDCHDKSIIHGDNGVEYNSMLETGAMTVECEDCHFGSALPNHSSWDPHNGALDCSACHAQTVVSCYNCHFESQVQAHLKRAKQPIHNFVILVNRTKDGQVGTASFQSLTYEGNSWVAFAPYHGHTITGNGRTCSDCHYNMGASNAAIGMYNSTGEIQFVSWDDNAKVLSWINGVIPMPEDYRSTFKMDFITYDGDPNDPVAPSTNWSYIGENTWDGHQMFFATPLSKIQMAKLGFDTTLTAITPGGQLPEGFVLKQNYPNPFNPSTTIEFQLPEAATVTLKVYNVVGAEVASMLQGQRMNAGLHRFTFDGSRLSSGVYLYQLSTASYKATRKMVLIR